MSRTPIVYPSVPRVAQPCSACPWRLANQRTPHPHGFYDLANIRRLWNGLRTGEAPGMSCHPTDPRTARFAGYEDTEGREMHQCAGSLVMLARELARFTMHCKHADDAGTKDAIKRYRADAGRMGMTRDGLASLAWMTMTGLSLPAAPEIVNDPAIGIPWLDWDPAALAYAATRPS